MPYSPKAHRLFEAAAHNPEVAKRVGIQIGDAKKMAAEGIKKGGKAAKRAQGKKSK